MNQKVEELLENEDVRRVAFSAASSFRGILSNDEIENCIHNAVWKASSSYDNRKSCKFTTYLHKGVLFECLSTKKFNSSGVQSLDRFDYFGTRLVDSYNGFSRVDMMDEIKQCDDPDLVYDRFYKNMTIKELADERGVCGETIRIRLEKNLKKIKFSLQKA